MAERQSSYSYEDLLACGRGELFGPGNAQLPLPPMLMFDEISSISEDGGEHGKGQLVATLAVEGNPNVEWFFKCHFQGDPVMPGVLITEAMAQTSGLLVALTAMERGELIEDRLFYLARADTKWMEAVRPGVTLCLESRHLRDLESLVAFRVRAFTKASEVATGSLTLARMDESRLDRQ